MGLPESTVPHDSLDDLHAHFVRLDLKTSELCRRLAAHDDLVKALQAIVNETMDYPPVRPYSADSYLPRPLMDAARSALIKAGAV